MNVVLRAKDNVSNAALGQIVDLNLKRIVQRQRIAHNAPPPNPASLEELVIPHHYQKYPVGQDNEELLCSMMAALFMTAYLFLGPKGTWISFSWQRVGMQMVLLKCLQVSTIVYSTIHNSWRTVW